MSRDKIIVALDLPTKEEALKIIDVLGDKISFYKVGSVLFTQYGPEIITELKKRNKKVFLDLKYLDIPNTVAHAVHEAVKLKVHMLTLHTSGGFRMLKEASLIADAVGGDHAPVLLGVTVLTSMKEKDLFEIGINRKVASQVKKLAVIAKNAGIKGIVCSSRELSIVKKVNKDFIAVVPGIRPAFSEAGDQKRTAEPAEAIKMGADYLVIGRPIIKAQDPLEAVEKIIKSIE
ncbi:orotidine-5'-phosphate decarboxylase [bacterium]